MKKTYKEIDLFPQLFVSDTIVGYSEYATINGTIIDEFPSKVTIYITLMPTEGTSDDLEALIPFNAKMMEHGQELYPFMTQVNGRLESMQLTLINNQQKQNTSHLK